MLEVFPSFPELLTLASWKHFNTPPNICVCVRVAAHQATTLGSSEDRCDTPTRCRSFVLHPAQLPLAHIMRDTLHWFKIEVIRTTLIHLYKFCSQGFTFFFFLSGILYVSWWLPGSRRVKIWHRFWWCGRRGTFHHGSPQRVTCLICLAQFLTQRIWTRDQLGFA